MRKPEVRSLRITEHHAKCKSVPAKVKEWAVEKLGRSRSAVKRQGKEAVKKMQGMFDDIAKESDQALITAPLNKNIRATELCHEAVSHFIYDNLCSSTSPQSKDTTDKTLLFNSDRGGERIKGEKSSLFNSDRGGGREQSKNR